MKDRDRVKHIGAAWIVLLLAVTGIAAAGEYWVSEHFFTSEPNIQSSEMPDQVGHDESDRVGHDATGQTERDDSRHPRLDRGSQAPYGVSADGYEFRRMTIERLPDLNIPRAGHMIRYINGELTVFGGHSTGFIPTGTAEYYKDGKWQLMGMIYSHDNGALATLPSGALMLCGGCEKPLGVGQTSYAESYDPATHRFRPLLELDWPCTFPSVICLADGTFVISGNWWREDAVVAWSPERGLIRQAPSATPRANPFILPVAPEGAIIFGSRDIQGGQAASSLVDQFIGDPFEVPLLREWHPSYSELNGSLMDQCAVGDPANGAYVYLIAASRDDGQAAILKVDGTSFSLLDLDRPLPKAGIAGEPVTWVYLLVDKTGPCAWVLGAAENWARLYVARVAYEEALRGGSASVRLFYAEDTDAVWKLSSIVSLPGGRLACVGGGWDNYDPSGQAMILHTEPPRRAGALWLLLALCLLASLAVIFGCVRHFRRTKQRASEEKAPAESAPASNSDDRVNRLMAQIAEQMEKKELFRRSGLTKEDLARAVSSNSRYVSDCINTMAGCSFIDYVNGYRIRYAQRLLYENPDMRLSEISEESGFSSEVTFYRNFKARTGQTPGEWLASQNR